MMFAEEAMPTPIVSGAGVRPCLASPNGALTNGGASPATRGEARHLRHRPDVPAENESLRSAEFRRVVSPM